MRTLWMLGAGVPLALFGCGDDDNGPPPIPPLASLELRSPGSADGDAPCVARGDDDAQSITVRVAVREFTLRPPEACSVPECGFVKLSLTAGDVTHSVFTAQPFTSVPTLDLPDGEVTLQAELLDTFGNAYRSRDDQPARCTTCTRTFRLATTCGRAR